MADGNGAFVPGRVRETAVTTCVNPCRHTATIISSLLPKYSYNPAGCTQSALRRHEWTAPLSPLSLMMWRAASKWSPARAGTYAQLMQPSRPIQMRSSAYSCQAGLAHPRCARSLSRSAHPLLRPGLPDPNAGPPTASPRSATPARPSRRSRDKVPRSPSRVLW